MSSNGEEWLRWHPPSPQICTEKLLSNHLHHEGAGGQVFCMHSVRTKRLWFYSIDSILWQNNEVNGVHTHLPWPCPILFVRTTHLLQIFLVSWADCVAKKRWNHFECVFFIMLFCILGQEALNPCSSGRLECSIFIWLKKVYVQRWIVWLNEMWLYMYDNAIDLICECFIYQLLLCLFR